MESLLTDEEVLSSLTRVTAEKGINFSSDRWIALKFLLEFLEVIFFGGVIQSLITEVEVYSRLTRITA
jgi:hypothetical protein